MYESYEKGVYGGRGNALFSRGAEYFAVKTLIL